MKNLEEKEFERGKETFGKGVVSSFLKSSVFCVFLFLAAAFQVFAENMQIVFPKTAFTGDTIEIKYIFHSDTDILPQSAFKTAPKFELSTEYEVFKRNSGDFYLKEIFLEKLASDYTLTLKIVPWKPGNLYVPAFNLVSLARFSIERNSEENHFGQNFPQNQLIINLKPIQINSIAEKTDATDFRPQAAPKTMPGTFAYLALTFVFYIALVFALIFVILKLPATARIFKKINYLLSLKRNSRKTAKKLKKLLKLSPEIQDDKDFAQRIQQIMRGFLNKRFSRDFSSVPTSAIYKTFLDLMGGELSENQDSAVEPLIEIFFRTDFIRYSPGQKFQEDERTQLVSKSLSLLALFDSEEEI